eukprot:2675858-Karenia_brevis.AAC.1
MSGVFESKVNLDIVSSCRQVVAEALARFRTHFFHVKSHKHFVYNERAGELAEEGNDALHWLKVWKPDRREDID